ncbi:MAG: peptidylprolyl isomerase [Clostridia bacterium]|nr:peptidylprolyl isomerase [Clostridia bacterium]
MLFVLCACSEGTYTTSKTDDNSDVNAPGDYISEESNANSSDDNVSDYGESDSSKDISGGAVKFTMENGGSFIVELYPQYAPETVENFKNLVATGFYDGLTFHRVVEGFMAQGGDPEGTGNGGSKETITGEFALNGFDRNTLSHTRGVISMARSQMYDSASSQFFICYDDASFLDGQYAAFGKVVEGMEVVDSFLEVERRYNSIGELADPVEPIVIESAVIVE